MALAPSPPPVVEVPATVTVGLAPPSPATTASYCFWTAAGPAPTNATSERSPEASPWLRSATAGWTEGPSLLEHPLASTPSTAGTTSR